MKSILLSLILAFALLSPAQAKGSTNIQFSWTLNAPAEACTAYRIYERTGAVAPFVFTKVADVGPTIITTTLVNVPAGSHTYVFRPVNAGGEAADSNPIGPVTVIAAPGVNNTVTIVVIVQ